MSSRHAFAGLALLAVVLGGLLLLGPGDAPGGAAPSALQAPPGEPAASPVSPDLERAPRDADAPAALRAAPRPESAAGESPTSHPTERSATGSIRGVLVDPQGQPVAGEPVDLLAQRDPWAAARPRDAVHDVVDRGRSDDAGRFELRARPGATHALFAGGLQHPRQRVAPVGAGADLRVELTVARTLSGHVVAEQTGLPVPGARVGAHSGDDRLFTRADADGAFSLGPLRDELLVLTGFAPGFDVAISEPLAPDWGAAVVRLPPGRQLAGRILDTATEQPVEAARVTLRMLTETRPAGEPDPLAGRRLVHDYTADTDPEGRYAFADIPSRAYRVLVEAEGYRPSTSDRYFGSSPDFDEELVIGLVPADDLSGQVRREGEAAVGARVQLLADERTLATTTCDDEGAFALPTRDWDGLARLALTAADDSGATARRVLDAAALAAPLDLELVAPFVLDVLVRGAAGPHPGAHVLAVSAGALPDSTVTDGEGRAQLVHELRGPDAEAVWIQARHGDVLSLAARVELDEPRPDEPFVIELDDGAWFEGVVRGAHGLALAGASVATRRGRFTTSRPDGSFRLGPAPLDEAGALTLVAHAPGHRRREWTDVRPSGDLVLDLVPVLTWGALVLDAATAEPLERFQCRLQTERRGADAEGWDVVEARVARTGEPGGVCVELPGPGRYRLQALARDRIAAESPPVDFDGVHEPLPVELQLAEAAVLEVRVSGSDGRPVPGYRVWLVPMDRAGERATPAGVSGQGLRVQRTDHTGLTRFNLGRGGRLRLASGPGAWIDGGPVSVAPGAHVERRVRVASTGGLDLAPHDEFGEPVAGLRVALRAEGEGRVHSIERRGTVEQALALIEVRDLPEGPYLLSLAHDEFEPVTRSLHVPGGGVAAVDVTLRRRPPGDG